MKPLRKKLAQYREPQKYKGIGVYPYFTPISSAQNSVVTINGKQVLMLGSNSYLGLTNPSKPSRNTAAAVQVLLSSTAHSTSILNWNMSWPNFSTKTA